VQALICRELSESLIPSEVFSSPTVSTAAACASSSKVVRRNNEVEQHVRSAKGLLFINLLLARLVFLSQPESRNSLGIAE